MIVVGLTGRAGSGKSVVADHLVAEHGFTKLSFAGPLKKMLRTLDPVLGESAEGVIRLSTAEKALTEDQIKLLHPEYRRLLQVLGTDCIRAVDEGFWVRAALAQLTDPDGRYVFDDVRFPNEAEAVRVKELRAYPELYTTCLWHVARPGHDGGAGAHVSEAHAGNLREDLEIPNIGSIGDLKSSVDLALQGVI